MADEIPSPKPKRRYELNANDRRLLRSLRIAQDEPKSEPDTLPLNPPRIVDEEDGA